MQASDQNRLFFGDNLHVLREHVADASVDLIYLDPPFNSKRDYKVLFKRPKAPRAVATGKANRSASTAEEEEASYAETQITAFEDTWHWGQQASGRCGRS